MRPDRRRGQLRLADGWDANAEAWIEWTRRGLDSYGDHKLAFLPLIPAAGRLTVDVGSGEGRVSRELQAQGHRVVALDRSFVMVRSAAAHADEPVPAVVADAVQLPLADAAADCVVAFMCLQDIDNVTAAIAEIGRVLAVGGKLVMAIVHPLNSAGDFDRTAGSANAPFVIEGAYTQARHFTDTRTRGGLSMTYHGIHRPLNTYTGALAGAGLVIEQLREQTTDDPGDKWYRIPLFLHIVASRPGTR